MKQDINGMEYDKKTTMSEFVEMQKRKGSFEQTAEGFNLTVTAEDLRPSAQDLINEVGLNPLNPRFFKNIKPVKESDYLKSKHETIIRGVRK